MTKEREMLVIFYICPELIWHISKRNKCRTRGERSSANKYVADELPFRGSLRLEDSLKLRSKDVPKRREFTALCIVTI